MSWTVDPRYTPSTVRTMRAMPRSSVNMSTITPAPRTLAERIATAVVPDGRKWADMRNKVQGALEFATPLGAEQPLRDARSSYQSGNRLGAAGLTALAMASAIPGVGSETKGAVGAGRGIFGKRGIIAYHGSPHSFDKFSLDKIGTGEGAQAYGHGLYFAEKEGVAKAYRDTLAGDGFLTGSGEVFDPSTLQHKNVKVMAGRGDLDGAISRAREIAMENGPVSNLAAEDLRVLQSIKDSGGIRPNPGSMYQVRINANPEDFLDWDKGGKDAYGNAIQDLLNERRQIGLVAERNSATDVSRKFAAQGIPGIKYLDQGSRGAGEGSRNYVVFDDALIEILKKYGIAAPVLGMGAMAATQKQDGGL